MAADVYVVEVTGTHAAPVYTQISGAGVSTAARYCTQDTVSPGLNNPIPIPAAGYNYSYWKTHGLELGGTFTQIDNIKWYTDGTLFTGLGTGGFVMVGTMDAGDEGMPSSNYCQAGGTPGTTGLHMDLSHPYYSAQTNPTGNASHYEDGGTELTVDTGAHTIEGYSKMVVTQVKVDTDATSGTKADETYTFEYDEIS